MARRTLGLSITFEQAKAALVNLRIKVKFATIQPGEIWDALSRAAGSTPNGEAQKYTDDPQTKAEALALSENPERLDRLGRQWLGEQGPKVAHWEPYGLVHPSDPLKWHWGARFVLWARGRE